MKKVYFLALILLSTLYPTLKVSAQCGTTPIAGDLIISANTTLSGTYNISGLFRVETGIVVTVESYASNGCGELIINADEIEVIGDIIADGTGFPGGTGGNGGAGGNNAAAVSGCIDKDNCLAIDVDGGSVGAVGSGAGSGASGVAGTQGAGPKQKCNNFGDDYGFVGGAGGAGGSGGGSYGGAANNGGTGGNGAPYNAGNFSGMSITGCASPSSGTGGTGGAVGVAYGTNNGTDIDLGSGGAGGGGGGKSAANGGTGGAGGNGGGLIALFSSGPMTVAGNISVNGGLGDTGGSGGNGGITNDCCTDLCNDCAERTFSSGAGGGGGAGGGSGGGIFLQTYGIANITGTLRSIGGNGGTGGTNGGGGGSCSYNELFCGSNSGSTNAGTAGNLGGGASGGRIKIFQNPCQANILTYSFLIGGGNGEGGQAADGSHFLGDIGAIVAPTLTVSADSVSCFGLSDGGATVVVNGGTEPFTYTWSPSGGNAETATGLAAGSYDITVVDSNSCSVTETVVVPEPDTLTAQIFGTIDADCFSANTGEISVMGFGGTEPYAYAWDDPQNQITETATNLVAGIYTVVLTDINGCTASGTDTIGQAEPFAATVTIDSEVSCNGGNNGQATVTASGQNLSYQWDDPAFQQNATATDLPAGSWTVTVSSSQTCDTVITVVIGEPDLLTLIAVENQIVSCNGGDDGIAVVTQLGGTSPYTYQWDDPDLQTTDAASGLTAGTYNVIVTDANQCTETASVVVGEEPAISIAVDVTDASCDGGSDASILANVWGGVSNYTYLWNPGSAVGNPLTGVPAGTYSLLVTDGNGCEQEFTPILVQEPTAIVLSLVQHENVSCFGASDGLLEITAIGGTPGYTYLWDDPTAQATALAGSLPPGTYAVEVTDANGCTSLWQNETITQPDELIITVSSSTAVTCEGGADGVAESEVEGGTMPYVYSWDDPANQTGSTAIDLTTGIYTVTVTDFNGCVAQAAATIDPPINILTADFTLSPDSGLQPLDITVFNNSQGGTAYEWIFGDGNTITTFDTSSFQYLYADSGFFDVTLVAHNDVTGCTDTLVLENAIYIEPTSELLIPNVITPNGDGLNDVFPIDPTNNDFFPFKIRNIFSFHGEIYNRWGEQVYEWTQPLGGWDGFSTGGKEMEPGTYYYVITAKGVDGDAETDYEFTGYVTLIR